MISYVLKKIVGSQNEREIRRFGELTERINTLEPEFAELTNSELRSKTKNFIEIINSEVGLNGNFQDDSYYNKLQEVLNEIMPEAFAVVREAGRRTIGMRQFNVQLIGGMVLHNGRIAEMKTGEGKTLVAALPLFLNGITGYGSHLVTVNDYLAGRDATWMGPIYNLLDLKVGVINHDASYIVDWEDPERANSAIEKNLSVWPTESLNEELP
ncbi:MAG: preprotein translocase subunit SecA, partial [Thermodesulfobacteriota bacterium]